MAFCLTNGILPDEQFGFLKGRSAEWQLLYLLQRWHEALDKKRCVHAVFLDAAKAFDRVDHSMLLSKLCGIGLDGPALSWLRSYLSDRRIMTRVDDAVSDPLHITSGVPQGSVLGPLLFIIYFKDIPSVTQACSALFADDTLLFRDDCQGANGCCPLSSDLLDISTWAAQSNVSFNATKSAELCLGRTASSDALSLDGHCVNRVSSKLHLGVTLAANLSWNDHVNRVLQNISGPLALCKNLGYRHRLPSKPLRVFYLAYIRPRLEYCSAVWSGCSRRLQLRLEKVQIQAARAITRVYNLPNHQLLHLANLPTLAWRRRRHRLQLLWRLVHGLGPPQLQELLPSAAADRCHRALRSSHGLEFPSSNSTRFLSSFLAVTIPEWNSLPPSCVNSSSPNSFLSSLDRLFAHDKFSFGL